MDIGEYTELFRSAFYLQWKRDRKLLEKTFSKRTTFHPIDDSNIKVTIHKWEISHLKSGKLVERRQTEARVKGPNTVATWSISTICIPNPSVNFTFWSWHFLFLRVWQKFGVFRHFSGMSIEQWEWGWPKKKHGLLKKRV